MTKNEAIIELENIDSAMLTIRDRLKYPHDLGEAETERCIEAVRRIAEAIEAD